LHVSASSFENPAGNEKRPKNGWAREFREAERELRHHPESQDVVFRAAKAARVMRQFDRLDEIIKKAESKGVVIDDAEKFHLWNRWNEECASYKSQRTRVNEAHLQPFFSKIMNEDCSIDTSMFNCTSYSNTNALQCAACEGDVQLLERLVGMGAALDYSADNLSAVSSRSPKKPPGCTPLLLASCLGRITPDSAPKNQHIESPESVISLVFQF
jgi:hypothetical protein